VAISGATDLTIAASGVLTVSGDIAAPTGTNGVIMSGGTLKFSTLTAGGSAQLTLTSGTIKAGQINSPNNTITNAGVNYGTAAGDIVTLGPGVTIDQTADVTLAAGTLSIPSGTLYQLEAGKSILGGGALTLISVGGQLASLGAGTHTLVPETDITSTGLVNNASSGTLQLTNTAAGTGANKYAGTIAETGGGKVLLGGSGTTGAGGAVQASGLTTQNTGGGAGIVIQPSTTSAKDFNLAGNNVTMNGGPLTIDGTLGGTGLVTGSGTFRSGAIPFFGGNCPASSSCQLLLHAAQFASGASVTIPAATGTAPATNAVVETVADPFANAFNLNIAGNLLVRHDITTTAGSVPTIHITGAMNHDAGGAHSVQALIDLQSGGFMLNSTPSALTVTSPTAATNSDKLSGTIQTQGGASSAINLGGPNQTLFQLQGPLTTDTFTGGTSNCSGGGGTISLTGTNPTLQLDDGATASTLTIDGNFTAASGQIITGVNSTDSINGPGTVTCSGLSTAAIPGALTLTGSKLTPGGPLDINAPVNQSATTTIGGAGGTVNVNNTWTDSSGDILYTGTAGTHMVVNGNSLVYTGSGNVVNVPLTVNGTIEDNGSGTWELNPSTLTVTLNSSGTVKATSGTFKIDSLSTVSGNTLTNGTYTIATNGTLRLPTVATAGVTVLNAKLSIAGSGLLQDTGGNAGLANLSLINSGGSPASSLTFTGSHSETTALDDVFGTLAILGSASLDNSNGSGTTAIRSGGAATIDGTLSGAGGVGSGDVFVASGGLLKGTGTVTGSVENAGVLHPGDSPGTMNIGGNYEQDPNGKLNVEVNGPGVGQFGRIQVTGNVFLDLGSTVALLPSSAYAASAQTGDEVRFLRYFGTQSGSFSSTTVTPPLNNGRSFTVSNDVPGKVVRAIVGPPVAQPNPPTPTQTVTPTPTQTVTPTPTVTTPSLSGVGFRSSSFRRSLGTKLNLTLSENATVTVVITQRVRGRRLRGRCRTTNRTGTRCTLTVRKKTLTFRGLKGRNSFTFKPSLAPGTYTATITARNAAGRRSRARTLTFTIRR
jgi:hypothetical protein